MFFSPNGLSRFLTQHSFLVSLSSLDPGMNEGRFSDSVKVKLVYEALYKNKIFYNLQCQLYTESRGPLSGSSLRSCRELLILAEALFLQILFSI